MKGGLSSLRWRPGLRRTAAPAITLTRQQCTWLLATAALSLAPHLTWLPTWIMGFGFVLLGWRALLLWRGSAPPPRLVLLALVIAAAVGVWFLRQRAIENTRDAVPPAEGQPAPAPAAPESRSLTPEH